MKNAFVLSLAACSFLPVLSADSLWTAPGGNERSMLADRKACSVGDIVTVVVAESAATQSTQSKTTNSSSSIDATVGQFLFPTTASKFGTHNGSLPGVSMGGKNESAGGGAVNNSQNVTARAAVLVTDVLPNGNLVIEGVRRVTFAGETQHVILHGMIRPDDVTSVNTVASSSIADARVEFISEGSLSDAQKKGWIAKLYDKLRPY